MGIFIQRCYHIDMTVRKNKGRSLTGFPEEYIMLDTETTGLQPAIDSIIEIGAIHYRNHRILDTFSALVRPDSFTILYDDPVFLNSRHDFLMNLEEKGVTPILREDNGSGGTSLPETDGLRARFITPFIANLTHITDDMLAQAPYMDDILPSFLDFAGDSVIIGHNVSFDINFIYDTVLRHGFAPFTNDYIDTLRLSRRLLPSLHHHRLSDLASLYGIDTSHAHRAFQDVLITQAVYENLYNEMLDQYGSLEAFEQKTSPRYRY